MLQSIWKVLDANKTILLGAILTWLSGQDAKLLLNPVWLELLQQVFSGLALLSAGHHFSKGSFKKDRN